MVFWRLSFFFYCFSYRFFKLFIRDTEKKLSLYCRRMLFQHNSSSISSFLVSVFQVFFSVLRTISVITAFFKVHTRELQHNRPLAATFKNKADKRFVIFSREKSSFFSQHTSEKMGMGGIFFSRARSGEGAAGRGDATWLALTSFATSGSQRVCIMVGYYVRRCRKMRILKMSSENQKTEKTKGQLCVPLKPNYFMKQGFLSSFLLT